ncbi:MAG: hypothetical protein QXK93_01925 [Candidatus Bathyarchaeia archaeon]|nr:hypothetical protein [Candidatus Bathyarchaeota archaeon]
MKTNYRKIAKFLTLLFTSLLISYASAASYSELFIRGTDITIAEATVRFFPGGNTTQLGGDDAINPAGTEVTFDSITIQPGQVLTYDEAVNITNSASSAKTITLTLVSLTGDFQGNFDYVNITVIAQNGTVLGSIKVFPAGEGTNSTQIGPLLMPANETWAVQWSLKADKDATSGKKITIVIKIKVE